jgi:anthraniloyl-CoA monooxygenase
LVPVSTKAARPSSTIRVGGVEVVAVEARVDEVDAVPEGPQVGWQHPGILRHPAVSHESARPPSGACMRIVCIGGGPAGLYFALLMKKLDPAHRHHGGRAQPPVRHLRLGRGVLRRDDGQHAQVGRADGRRRSRMAFNHWDDIELTSRADSIRSGGHGFVRHRAARSCSTSCRHAARSSAWSSCSRPRCGLRHATTADADLVIASDGVNSRIRQQVRPRSSSPTSSRARTASSGWARTKLYDAFNFHFEQTEHGWFQAHVYKFDDQTTTFIVETPEHCVDRRTGSIWPPARSRSAFCETLFAKYLDGHPLMTQRAPPARLGVARTSSACAAGAGTTSTAAATWC